VNHTVKLIKDPHIAHHPDQLSKGYPGSAAHDLYLPIGSDSFLYPNQSKTFDLGIRIHIDNENIAADILPRSGTGSKGLVVGNLVGLIDQDYQGELKVCLWNRTDEKMAIDSGKAVAQLVFRPIIQAALAEVDSFDSVSERGEGGFGSSDSISDHYNPETSTHDRHRLVFEGSSVEVVEKETYLYSLLKSHLPPSKPLTVGDMTTYLYAACQSSDVDKLLTTKMPCNAKVYKGDEVVYELEATYIEATNLHDSSGWVDLRVYVSSPAKTEGDK